MLRPDAASLLVGSLVWAMLVLTHNLTAMMAALTLGGVLVVVLLIDRFEDSNRRIAWPILLWGLAPILLGAMLVAWYIAPALLESTWVGIGADPVSTGYANHFVTWQHLFDWSPIYTYPEAADPTVPLPGYVAALLLAGLLLVPLARRSGLLQPLGIGLFMTVAAIWLTTDSSAFLWQATAPVLGKLQFPWRWQTIVALGAGLLAAVVAELALRAIPAKARYRSVLAWGLVILAIGYVIVAGVAGLDVQDSSLTDDDITREQMWAFDAEFGQVGMTWTGEFLPRWVSEQRWAIGREPSDGSSAQGLPGVNLSVTPQQIGYQSARYQVDAAEPTTLIWHRFYFPAWQVSIDGTPVETFPSGDLGLLSATAPSGKHDVAVRWSATPTVVAGRLAAVVAWALLLALLWYGKARRRMGLWLATGRGTDRRPQFPAGQTDRAHTHRRRLRGLCGWNRQLSCRRRPAKTPRCNWIGWWSNRRRRSTPSCMWSMAPALSWPRTMGHWPEPIRLHSVGRRGSCFNTTTKFRCPTICRRATISSRPASTNPARPTRR